MAVVDDPNLGCEPSIIEELAYLIGCVINEHDNVVDAMPFKGAHLPFKQGLTTYIDQRLGLSGETLC